jgi:REP element-mobilizing transposase RayT
VARQLRVEYEGAFYHITSRGNQREKIFWDDKDREELKRIIKRTKERYGYLLHAYVFMDNHYHLLIETPHANIKQVMQNINTSYTVSVNKRHKRYGHLFQGRYKAFIVDKDSYLLELNRYINLNPVRANIVQRPEDYKWSSYRAYIGAGDGITDTEDTLYAFAKKRAIAVRKYKDFVEVGKGETSPLGEAVGSVLGDERFREKVIKYIKGKPDKTEISDIKKIEKKHRIEKIIKVVAKYYKISEEELLKRKKATGSQRKKAIYLCKLFSGQTNAEVGRLFGITLQAVTNAVRGIEKGLSEDKGLSREMALIKKEIDKQNV